MDYQVPDRRAERARSTIVRAEITRGLPIRDNQFDHAVMLAVLEHLSEPAAALREAFRVLVPGGSLVMTWPSQAVDPMLTLLHRMRVISDEMEGHRHVRRLALATLLALLRRIGFERCVHRLFELGLNHLVVAYKPRAFRGHPGHPAGVERVP